MNGRVEAARLRGGLPVLLDSRLVEQAARSGCQRFRTMVASGAGPNGVSATRGHRLPPMSPVAANLGMQFEDQVYANNAELLRVLYEHHLGITLDADDVVDLRRLTIKPEHGDPRQRSTDALVRRRFESGEGKTLVVGPRFSLETPSGTFNFMPDYLYAPPGSRRFRVGEIKSYLDMDGRTDPAEIGTAVRQEAVSIVGIRRIYAEEFGPGIVENDVDLVMRSLRSRRTPEQRAAEEVPADRLPRASLHTLDASVEVATIGEFVSSLAADVADALTRTGGRPLGDAGALEAIPHRWEPSCMQHCALEPLCREEARGRDAIELLGTSAAQLLEGVESVERAVAIASGRVAPENDDEERVAAALRLGWETSAALEGAGQ